MPACVLVHGLGMSKEMWADPSEARVMGGLLPLTSMLKGYDTPRTLFHDLKENGHTMITWTQRRPVGPAEEVVAELMEVINTLNDIPHDGLILIGHSRGGLAARAALNEQGFPSGELRGLITLASPHEGSDLSRWAGYVKMATSLLPEPKTDDRRKSLAGSVNRILGFIQSRGVSEIMPGSDFLRSLPPTAPAGAYCFSAGGTNPALIEIGGMFSFPSSLSHLIPSSVLPEELSEGKGDGLVSALSSRLPCADEHMDFAVNHAAIAVDEKVRASVIERIRKNCLS